MKLGTLGRLVWFRCRWCGQEYSQRIDDTITPSCPSCWQADDETNEEEEA